MGVPREAEGEDGGVHVVLWPESFPAECPPVDSVPARGEFYRLVATALPSADDFRNHHELLAVGGVRGRYWSDDCDAAGLSVFSSREETEYLRESTGAMRRKKIARGKLDGLGRMKHTPHPPKKRTHHTWWVPVGDEAWKTFKVVS